MSIREQLDPVVTYRLDEYAAAVTSLDAHSVSLPSGIEIIDTEFTPDALGMKVVFTGTRDDGKIATFETGSFLDNGGLKNASDRHDICVSTAGGCTRACRFCSVPNSELGFERLLTAEELAVQTIYTILERNREATMPNALGFMGNGEPPDNAAVIPAVHYLAGKPELNIERITFSTIGENIAGIDKMAKSFASLDMRTIMQFSLHAADEAKRRSIIPGRKPLDKILEAVDGYSETTGEAVKFNVVLMEGSGDFEGFTNASSEDARKLAQVLTAPSAASGNAIRRLLKLSAYNSVPGIPFKPAPPETVEDFVSVLAEHEITEIQWFRGSGIEIDEQKTIGGFACGQLRATTPNALAKTHQ
jgi:adenine C2-methylase RlmN of 23S rRNA A2503 and tRNA A37